MRRHEKDREGEKSRQTQHEKELSTILRSFLGQQIAMKVMDYLQGA